MTPHTFTSLLSGTVLDELPFASIEVEKLFTPTRRVDIPGPDQRAVCLLSGGYTGEFCLLTIVTTRYKQDENRNNNMANGVCTVHTELENNMLLQAARICEVVEGKGDGFDFSYILGSPNHSIQILGELVDTKLSPERQVVAHLAQTASPSTAPGYSSPLGRSSPPLTHQEGRHASVDGGEARVQPEEAEGPRQGRGGPRRAPGGRARPRSAIRFVVGRDGAWFP